MVYLRRSIPVFAAALMTFPVFVSGWSAASRSCEVVGADGRMGSQWLRQPRSQAVPRGVCPGYLSESGTPIYVCTPASAWTEIYQLTDPPRRDDLVWIGNGLLPDDFSNTTAIVPHYGILSVGAKPVTSPDSPPTFIYGKHAVAVAAALQSEGIKPVIVGSWNEIQIAAARKLLWASCMWLLCHYDKDGPSITAAQVHQSRQSTLAELVRELLPVLRHLAGCDLQSRDEGSNAKEFYETMLYMRAYSESMPGAIPSLELALSEVRCRNGVWLKYRDQFPQPLHRELLERVGAKEVLNAFRPGISSDGNKNVEASRIVNLRDIGMSVSGVDNSHVLGGDRERPRSAVVVGSGVIGSKVALNLSRRGVKVTVVDCLPPEHVGLTTPASWAWLNANQKTPPSYKWMNVLGMVGWTRDEAISSLPTWNGCLVQYQEELECISCSGYETEGPLSRERLLELEPNANFTFDSGPIYFFPCEGFVDPSSLVVAVRDAAKENGVIFLPQHNVTRLVRDQSGRVIGLECDETHSSLQTGSKLIFSDLVVMAAGAQSGATGFGGIPLLHKPGRVLFASTPSDTASSSSTLSRILVDTVNEAHVLQRRDRTLVVGGGYLEIGGSTGISLPTDPSASQKNAEEDALLAGARQLAPEVVRRSSYSHTSRAIRPMPKDGLPVTGFLEPGLYAVVTHSGVTLSPFLTSAAAAEIAENISLHVFDNFRPQRFE